MISNGNIASNVATLVKKKTSSSNKIATFELTGLNANDFQGGKIGRILYSLDIVTRVRWTPVSRRVHVSSGYERAEVGHWSM